MSLRDFDEPMGDPVAKEQQLIEAVNFVSQHAQLLEPQHVNRLMSSISSAGKISEESGITYDSDFSIASMIEDQLNAVKALRNSVFINGQIREGVSVRDAQSVISTTNSMIANLTKNHESVQGIERARIIERTLVDVLKEINPSLKDRFFELLEAKLDNL